MAHHATNLHLPAASGVPLNHHHHHAPPPPGPPAQRPAYLSVVLVRSGAEGGAEPEAAETMEQSRRACGGRLRTVTHHRWRQVQSYQTDGSNTQSAKRGQPPRSLP